MTLDKFYSTLAASVQEGDEFDNPGGGISTIIGLNEERMKYERGSSLIYLKIADLHRAYVKFKGRAVSSFDLRTFKPSVFSSTARPAGHSCNCTMFFMIMQRMGKADEIVGSGVRGDPYSVNLS